jgi:hypothetical protein
MVPLISAESPTAFPCVVAAYTPSSVWTSAPDLARLPLYNCLIFSYIQKDQKGLRRASMLSASRRSPTWRPQR